MENIFASAKNNIIHNDDHYVRFEFIMKYLTPVQLLQMGIDDYAEMLKSAKSVQRTFATCAPELHAKYDDEGDLYCRFCGQPLSR